MALRPEIELVIVPGKFQRRRHFLVRKRPVPMQIVQILRPILKKNPDRFLLGLADERRVNMAAPDVGETPDVTQHLAKGIRTLPSHRPRADPPAADAADGALSRVFRQVIGLAHFRQNLLQQKLRIGIPE